MAAKKAIPLSKPLALCIHDKSFPSSLDQDSLQLTVQHIKMPLRHTSNHHIKCRNFNFTINSSISCILPNPPSHFCPSSTSSFPTSLITLSPSPSLNMNVGKTGNGRTPARTYYHSGLDYHGKNCSLTALPLNATFAKQTKLNQTKPNQTGQNFAQTKPNLKV